MLEILARYGRCLTQLTKERTLWLKFSIVFSVLLLLIVVEWRDLILLNSTTVWGVIISILVVVSAIWWYWTMKIVVYFLKQQLAEVSLLDEVIYDIGLIKQEIEELKKRAQ